MLARFTSNKRLLLEALSSQKLVGTNTLVADALADRVQLMEVKQGEIIIEQNAYDNDIYLILAGSLKVNVNGRAIARRVAGDSVGEMAALDPAQPRSATVIADELSVVAKISEPDLAQIAESNPSVYKNIAKVLANRLLQRNTLVGQTRTKSRLFVISSREAAPIAQAIQTAFAHDNFVTTLWTDNVFRIANYALQSLEDEVDRSDFAVAIAHTDDVTESRNQTWPAPRDNVIFELGLFMGRLGKHRAILMEPRGDGVKLPSDLSGITTIPYRFAPGDDMTALLAPACNLLRDHINKYGPNN